VQATKKAGQTRPAFNYDLFTASFHAGCVIAGAEMFIAEMVVMSR
jgi:hypothetical protein